MTRKYVHEVYDRDSTISEFSTLEYQWGFAKRFTNYWASVTQQCTVNPSLIMRLPQKSGLAHLITNLLNMTAFYFVGE